MMPGTDLHDPLGDAADPRGYVPLDTDERALDALLGSLLRRCSPILLVGPSGVGKTILLRVLAQRLRLRAHRVVYSPFLHLPPEEVARWLLHLLGKRIGREAPAEALLLAEVRARRSRATALLIDELQCTPVESVRLLQRVARAGRPALAVVAAGICGPALDALLPALAPGATVSLPDALPSEEIGVLCDSVLGSCAVPRELRARALRDRDTIMRRSRGLPILLKGELALRAYEVAAGRDGIPGVAPPVERALALDALPVDVPGVESPAVEPSCVQLQVAVPATASHDEGPTPPSLPLGARARAALRTSARAASRAGVQTLSAVRRAAASRGRALSDAAALLEVRWRTFVATRRAGVSDAGAELAQRCRRAGRTVAAARTALPRMLRQAADAAAAWSRALRQAAALSEARVRRFAAAGGTRVSNAADELERCIDRAASAAAAAASGLRLPRSFGPAAPWIVVTAVLLGALLVGRGDLERRPPVSAAPVSYPAPEPERASPSAPAPLVRVQVNARPWAHVRVDGRDAGATPLGHLQLAPGPHDFEATFPDGRVVRRRVEISPEQRFVTLP